MLVSELFLAYFGYFGTRVALSTVSLANSEAGKCWLTVGEMIQQIIGNTKCIPVENYI